MKNNSFHNCQVLIYLRAVVLFVRMENWLDMWSNATKRFIDMSHSMPVA